MNTFFNEEISQVTILRAMYVPLINVRATMVAMLDLVSPSCFDLCKYKKARTA